MLMMLIGILIGIVASLSIVIAVNHKSNCEFKRKLRKIHNISERMVKNEKMYKDCIPPKKDATSKN